MVSDIDDKKYNREHGINSLLAAMGKIAFHTPIGRIEMEEIKRAEKIRDQGKRTLRNKWGWKL